MGNSSGRSGITVVIIVAVVAVLLAVSNPSKTAYAQWLVQQAEQQSQSSFTKGLVGLFSGIATDLIVSSTTQQNFVVGSMFTTELDSQNSITVLGIAGQFFPLSGPSTTSNAPARPSAKLQQQSSLASNSSSTAGSEQGTRTFVFFPNNFAATSTVQGNCWTSSIASARSDAYRCMAGNYIYDPCFVYGSNSVACPTVGTGIEQGTVIDLTQPLPQAGSDAPGAAPPFALELANGDACNIETGAGIANFPFMCGSKVSLACESPSAPVQGTVYVQCGPINSQGQVPSTKPYAVAVIYK